MVHSPELLSPAGGFDAARAAFQYGADAIYLGLPRFSARAEADNITTEKLRILLAYARTFTPRKKIYITFNTVVQDVELPAVLDALTELNDLAPDGVIVQDLGVASLIRNHFPRLALHASTQLAAHSLEGVRALKELGFTRVVLAREMTLAEISEICAKGGVEIEIFVHGALCYSISGLCLFSSHTQGRSGNRGRCAYCCRESFDGRYPFSMRDLAFSPLLDKVVATGAASLKIEGRMKSPLYVACVTDYYRKKLDGVLTPEQDAAMVQDLQTVFSRPWTQLYAEGMNLSPEKAIDPVGVGHRGARIGEVESLRKDAKGLWLRFTSNRALEKHDGIQVELPQGGRPFGCAIDTLRCAGSVRPEISLPAGMRVEISLPRDAPQIPAGSPVFCSASQAVKRRYEIHSLRESELLSGTPLDIAVRLAPGEMSAHADRPVMSHAVLPLVLTPARQPERTPDAIRRAFERMGETDWRLGTLTIEDPQGLYAPPSKLNDLRRILLENVADEKAKQDRNRCTGLLDLFAKWKTQPALRKEDPPARICKFRVSQRPPSGNLLSQANEIVLNVEHHDSSVLMRLLDEWKEAAGSSVLLRLALPLFTRNEESDICDSLVSDLLRHGWNQWETADLSGCRRLRRLGVSTMTADWSFYAFHAQALRQLSELGVVRAVLSPEKGKENFSQLSSLPLPTELPVFQHTPLFLSFTRPCAETLSSGEKQATLLSRERVFTVEEMDRIWVTTLRNPFCLINLVDKLPPFSAWRFDFSWSPTGTDIDEILNNLLQGCHLSDIRTGNFSSELI